MACGPLLSCGGGGISSTVLRSLVVLPKGAAFRGCYEIGGRRSGRISSSGRGRFLRYCYGHGSPGGHLELPTAGGRAGRRGVTKIVLNPCHAQKKDEALDRQSTAEEGNQMPRGPLQAVLWSTEAAYILWLFLLPYAPVAIPFSPVVGFHAIEAPVLHPMSEGLFNFVIGWTFMFAPLLFTDYRRDRYGGSLDVLWGFQMFLTNTFLIPYMAIRLNDDDAKRTLKKPYQLVSLMSKGAPIVGTIGGVVCLISALWAVYGRADGGYGELTDRLEFLGRYLGSERLAYAFIWDIILYAIFQPWLIGANLQNAKESTLGVVRTLRFIPVVGLVAYLLCLEDDGSLRSG
ncbi:hypothetical protein Taro_040560 [Colocasia esculenta]|uniref:Uncharacterized protein n=1 Tax=Colocasia esculenta TaxID=4460 RepID=A0A843WUX8_COLES|nr:hypothetical protein [Colocasia esculenta]